MSESKDSKQETKKALFSVWVPEPLFVEFKKKAVEKRQSMTEAFTELATRYVSK